MRDRAVGEQLGQEIERGAAEADKALDAAAEVADKGDPADQKVIDDAWDKAAEQGHKEQVTGYPPNGRMERAYDLWKRYQKARLARCKEHPMTPAEVLAAERRAQLFGDTLDVNGSLRRCLVKEYAAEDTADSAWGMAGVVPDVTRPFTLPFTTQGQSGTIAFTPTGEFGGSAQLSMGVLTASGTYTLTDDGAWGYDMLVTLPKVCTPVPGAPCYPIWKKAHLVPVFFRGK